MELRAVLDAANADDDDAGRRRRRGRRLGNVLVQINYGIK